MSEPRRFVAPPSPPEMPDEVLVAIGGMHRSGTSLLARIVELLGVSLGNPEDLLAPGDDNRAGYFEHRAIKTFDDELLAELGGSWDRPPRLLAGWEHDPTLAPWRADAARVLAASFGPRRPDDPPIGFKDPRVSVLLPFWRTVLPVRTSIVMVRDPREVAASLAARRFRVDADTAASLWLRYLLAASRTDPDHLLLTYRSPFEDLEGTVERVVAHLGLPAPDADVLARIAAHVDPSLLHQRADDSVAQACGPVESLALRVWNNGAVDIDLLGAELVTTLAEGRLQPHADQQEAARARADAASFKSQLKHRNAQVRALERKLDQASRIVPPSSAPPIDDVDDSNRIDVAVPEDLYLDPIARTRLIESLSSLAPVHRGVVSPVVPLPPGASSATHAERAQLDSPALRPFLDHRAQASLAVRGSLDSVVVSATTVELGERTEIMEDRSAPTHNPWLERPAAEAEPDGRPPFPQRPVVVFCGTTIDDDIDDIARAWVNDLVRLGVEARLAVPAPPPGMHLTAPCLPSAQTIRALAPDVVVALDDDALDIAIQSNLETPPILARVSQDSVDRVVWGAWDHGTSTVRARIGRRSGAREIQAAVARLASGPHAVHAPARHASPSDDDDVAELPPGDPLVVAVVPEPPGATEPRASVIAEALAAREDIVHRGLAGLRHAGRFATDLTVVEAGRKGRHLDRIVSSRAAASLTTVVRITGDDVVVDRDAPDGIAGFTDVATRRLSVTGLALVPSKAIARAAASRGATVALMPPVLPQTLLTRLGALGETYRADAVVLGWILDPGSAAPPPSVAPIAAAIAALVEENPDVRIEVHAPSKWDPGVLARHSRITVSSAAPRTDSLARWAAQIWSPSTRQLRVLGRSGPLVEACAAGVPTILSRGDASLVGGLADPATTVTDRNDMHLWLRQLQDLCDPDYRAVVAQRSRRQAQVRAGAIGRSVLADRLVRLLEGAVR